MDTVVWLDLSRRVVMWRVITRTLRRIVTRELLWESVREPWPTLHSLDPKRNIILWAWTRFSHTRQKYKQCLAEGEWAHATVYRFRSAGEVGRWLASATTGLSRRGHDGDPGRN